MGSALTEYGLLIAVVALGLFAVLVGLRDAVGNLTQQTSVTITQKSGGGYGRGGGGGVRLGVVAKPRLTTSLSRRTETALPPASAPE
jgi:Flp pilus assembly pilin Flp